MNKIYAIVPKKVIFICNTKTQAPIEHFMILIGHGKKYYLSETLPKQGSKEDCPIVTTIDIDEYNYIFTVGSR